jgi:hypothetical protein
MVVSFVLTALLQDDDLTGTAGGSGLTGIPGRDWEEEAWSDPFRPHPAEVGRRVFSG